MEIDEPAIKDRLWHVMRADLAKYVPETADNKLLMCPTCGRFLPQEAFTLEHLIPLRSLADDPPEVKLQVTANQRSGNILLCGKPLEVDRRRANKSGCNGWKGKYYDQFIQQIFNGDAFDATKRKVSQRHTIAATTLAFLAIVRRYGYQVALTPAGVILRHQFFSPFKYVAGMPAHSQILFGGARPEYLEGALELWADPYRFTMHQDVMIVNVRNIGLAVPVSRDPNLPLARHLRFAPSQYTFKPDIRAFSD